MSSDIKVMIKRQPFDPPFVIQIGEENVSALINRSDNETVIANIKGFGIFKIDITDVGFWFVEKKAEPFETDRIIPEIHGTVLERMTKGSANYLGQYCGIAVSELRGLRDIFF